MRIGVPNKRYTTGIGYIIVPGDVDINTFILNCYRKETVCIINQDGEFIKDVNIDIDCLQKIYFPKSIQTNNTPNMGSCVVYVNEYVTNRPIIIGVLSKGNESSNVERNKFKLFKNSDNNVVSIVGNGDNGDLFIQCIGETGGNIYIDVSNTNKDAKFNLNVKGDININCTGNYSNNSSGTNLILKDGKLYLGGEDETSPIVFGDVLKEKLEALLDAINQITVPTGLGPSGVPINAATFTQIKGELVDILSTKNFVKDN